MKVTQVETELTLQVLVHEVVVVVVLEQRAPLVLYLVMAEQVFHL
jgi:hypothetical protein